MPPEREAVQQAINYTDSTFWLFMFLVVTGTVGRILISDEPFNGRRFGGELVLAMVSGVMLYSIGLLQGLDPLQMAVTGSLAGLGGVRFVEWLIKIAKKVREAT